MKHNNASLRATRHSKRTKGKSKYAAKVQAGNQMYGPGCCAHTVPESRLRDRREELNRIGWFRNPIWPSTQRQRALDYHEAGDTGFALEA